ncbi:hypothetical protein WJX73_004890 [Symbiochloris irregularis]|uniref:SLC41A/MgtE integral membrane domain-containing protein n=1 Tax=Symbiochloris irregularis TaxID=706552 RepID=A0AAW1PLQ1_9CHLO
MQLGHCKLHDLKSVPCFILHARPRDSRPPGGYHTASGGGRSSSRKRAAQIVSAAEEGKAGISVGKRVATAYDEDELKGRRGYLCESGLLDPELDESVCDIDEQPAEQQQIWVEAWGRGRWLLGLLVLQSMSSFVLDWYQQLLKDHLVITLFLTMLVGAGGNAGNQSAIKVIRGLATGSLNTTPRVMLRTLAQQTLIGVILGASLACGGFIRVYLSHGSIASSFAISSSLFFIVVTSVFSGTALPFALAKAGVDPANAGTSIQVIMDVSGCLITCFTCNLILNQLAGILPVS